MRKAKATTLHRMPITKARINLGDVARRVTKYGEYFILEKDGIPVIGIMGPDELEDYLESRDPKVQRLIERSHQEYIRGRTRPAEALLEDLRTASRRRAKSSKSRPI
ncbi:MAG: hypothetical protein ACT4P6_06890 [Gemmatimonadaceae bacterium]